MREAKGGRRKGRAGARESERPRRHRLRWALFALVALLVALVWGVGSAQTHYSFGPHDATYEVTYTSQVTVDLGPIGSIVVPGMLPQPLGVTVIVGEIPAGLGASTITGAVSDLSGDLNSYLQFFTSPGPTVQHVARALISDAAWRAGLAWLALVVVVYGSYRLLGAARRAQLALDARRRRAPIVAAAGVVVLLGAVAADQYTPASTPTATQVLQGTPLEGAYVTGRLGGLIDSVGTQAVALYDDNQRFFAAAAAHTQAALANDTMSRLVATGDVQAAVFVTDLHCNVGMAQVIAAAASGSGASSVLDGGDTTLSGTSVERYCVDTFAGALPEGVQWVVSPGNHDSLDTETQMNEAGMVVLDGAVVDDGALTVLGDGDPRHTSLGAGTSLKGEEGVSEMSQRMVSTACDQDDPVDVLLVHDGREMTEALSKGCAKLMLSGHMHKRVGPTHYGNGIWYQGSSTGKDVNESTQLGPLHSDAELTIWYFTAATGNVLSYRLLTVHPDTSVTLGPAIVP